MILARPGNIAEDVAVKAPVRVATTGANITLNGLQTIDGIALADMDRVLVKDQTDPTQNGIYNASSGNWQRTTDASKNTDFVSGTLVFVAQGAVNAGIQYSLTTTDNPVVLGTSLVTWANQTAVLGVSTQASSATSLAISSGSKIFATQSNKSFKAKQYVLAFSFANPDNILLIKIVSYVGGSLTGTVVAMGGAGTINDWIIVLTGSPLAAGYAPPVGGGNVNGPGSSGTGHLAGFADTTGLNLSDLGPAGALASLNQVDSGQIVAKGVHANNLADGAAPLPVSESINLQISNDVVDPIGTVDVAIGRVRSLDDTVNLALAAAMTKVIQTSGGWAAGTGGNGLDTGVKVASKAYDLHLIGKVGLAVATRARVSGVATLGITGHALGVGSSVRLYGVGSAYDGLYPVASVVDANKITVAIAGADETTTACSGLADGFDLLFCLNAATPSLPSGYTVRKVLGSVLTDGSANIRAFKQFGDEFWLSTPVLETSALAVPSSPATLLTTSAPANALWFGNVFMNQPSSSAQALASATFQPDSAPSVSASPGTNMGGGNGAGGTSSEQLRLPLDSLSQIRFRAIGSSSTVTVNTVGWRDPRRRLF